MRDVGVGHHRAQKEILTGSKHGDLNIDSKSKTYPRHLDHNPDCST